MSAPAEQVVAVRMPQVNVNDEGVTLVGWRVADGELVAQGQTLAEVETSKSVDEVPAPTGGIVRRVVEIGRPVAVGEVFAYIGPSTADIDAFLSAAAGPVSPANPSAPRITAGAVSLARRYGIDPSQVPAQGDTIRREDVERFARASGKITIPDASAARTTSPTLAESEEPLPPALAEKVGPPEELSNHQWAVAQHLSRTRARLVPCHVAMDAAMDGVLAWVEDRRRAGMMTGPLPLLLWAAAAALKAHPRMACFRLGRRVYPHRSIDIAFAARSRDGRLFTPVVRGADQLAPEQLVEECARLNMGLFRGQLKAEEVSGGCMTVSLLDQQPVLYHVGLQNAYQSTLLTAGAIREQVIWAGGRAVPQPTATLVLAYDHGLLDGWEASAFLAHIRGTLLALTRPPGARCR